VNLTKKTKIMNSSKTKTLPWEVKEENPPEE
jgi:hypothetical protein